MIIKLVLRICVSLESSYAFNIQVLLKVLTSVYCVIEFKQLNTADDDISPEHQNNCFEQI